MSSKTGPDSPSLQTGWTKPAIVIAGLIAYQVLVNCVVLYYPATGLGEALMVAPLLAIAIGVLLRTGRGRVALGLLFVAGIPGFLAWRASGASLALLYPLPHLAVYLCLLWWFAATLAPGRLPLITRLATHVHGKLDAPMLRYTRQVTWAWCFFFAAMALTSAVLFLFAPLPVWTVFNTLLNLPLVAAMYLAEYAWRLWRHPDFSHASIATVVRACRNFDFKRPAAGR
jgi:uncharacterized membrane protein